MAIVVLLAHAAASDAALVYGACLGTAIWAVDGVRVQYPVPAAVIGGQCDGGMR